MPATPSKRRQARAMRHKRICRRSYQRDAAGQINAISTQVPGRNKPVTPFVSNLTHTALGQPKAWAWVNGAAASRSFDADGRMTDTEFASYNYDDASRIASITQNLWASRTVTQTVGTTTATVTQLYQTPLRWFAGYDNRNRLTSFERAGAQTSYTYDANSNRLSAIDASTSDTDLDGQFEQSDFNQSTRQALNIASDSNRLLGFTQNLSKMRGDRTLSSVSTNVNYSLDAAGNLTSDGLRTFDYDEANRISKARVFKDGEAARISYLHNAQGQRVFKGEPTAEQTLPNEATLGQGFIDWLKANFKWMFAQAQANTSIGTAYTFGAGPIPSWAILGEYDNGAAKGAGRSEYIWLPTAEGAIPVGMYRNGNFFAIHTDHLGSPRLMTNEDNKPVWQWPYSAFGTTKPTGVLKATANPRTAVVVIDNTPLPPQDRPRQRAQAAAPMNSNIVLLQATAAPEMNLRFPGQYEDAEMGTFYNYFRSYQPGQGRYTQGDPIGLEGGLNRFAYVRGNPLSKTDPLGLHDLDITDGSFVPAGEHQSYNPLPNAMKPKEETVDRAVCIAKCMAGKAATGAGIAALGYGALEVAARTGAISPLATVGLVSVYKQYGKYYSTGKMAVNLQQCESQCDEKQCKAQ